MGTSTFASVAARRSPHARTGWSRIRLTLAAGTVAAALVLIVAPVSAATPAPVTIVSPMTFNPDGPNFGTFEASGSAVDGGLICASGSVVDTGIIVAGWQSGRGAQIPVRKTFTCDDGGSFFVKIQVHLDFATATETFSWVIMGGTDSYADLRGSGQGFTVSDGSDPQTGNINTYEGFVVR